MNALQKAIAFAGIALIAAALLGSVLRRRYETWWFFSAYLVAVFVCESLPHLAPEHFYTPDFWQAKETAYAGLRFGMASEVGVRTMRAFPGALATARRIVLLIVLVTLAAVATAPAGDRYTTFVGELQPRVLNGSIWMLMAIAAVILWYRLPVQPFHKVVLLSYIPYIVVFTMVSRYVSEAGWQRGVAMQYVNQLAYVALVAYWNYAIWRRDSPARLRSPQPPAQARAA
jgi:hypothetical protein